MKKLFFLLIIALWHFSVASLAQQGRWNPPGANLSYPRTLLQAADLPAVRASLGQGSNLALYSGLYASVGTAAPTSNANANDRRARATFAKNAAFVLLMGRKPVGSTLVTLPAAEHNALLEAIRSTLETINTNVEPFAGLSGNYNEWQWRSKELIDYMVAYDLLRGAGTTAAELQASQTRLQEFAGNLHQQSTRSFFGVSFYNSIKNNHTLMTAAALGLSAAVLNDAESANPNLQPTSWINTGLYYLDNVLWQDAQRQSDPTAMAGYAEGPYYFKYAFLNCLPFFRTMGHFLPAGAANYTAGGNTRSIPNPYYDPRYHLLYDWVTAIMMPDGRFPALEDSYVDMGMPELALTGQSRYVRPLHLQNLAGPQMTSLAAQLRDVTVDMRAAYLAANTPATEASNAHLTALPQSGNLIFRSGNDTLATYLHLYGKNGPALTNSGGHNQADASSFVLHAYGQLLALDAGYLSYSRRNEVGTASSHNMLLVDGNGPGIGTTGAANDAPATVQNSFETSRLSYGEVQTAYQNASITRKMLFVRNSYFLLADFVTAPAAHTYTWQLHGYGLENGTATTGTFTANLANHEGTWHKNGAQLRAHVTAAGGASVYGKATSSHELAYNTTEDHTTLMVQKSGSGNTQFLAALYPFTTLAPALTTTSTSTTAGLLAKGPFTDAAFTQADTVLTTVSSALPQPLAADALLAFYSLDTNGAFAQLFVEQGKTLRYGLASALESTRRATISWQKTGSTQYEGYVSRATTLRLPLPQAPTNITGLGVQSFSYDQTTQQLTLHFNQASGFVVNITARPLPVSVVKFAAQRQASGPVQLSWRTASELRNKQFILQRQTADEKSFHDLCTIAGAGRPTDYSWLDSAAPAGKLYYRLQQTDFDGTTFYSAVVAVGATAPAACLQVAPVPAQQYLAVTFSGPGTHTRARLLNHLGQAVLEQDFQQQAQLNVSHLAPGLYHLSVVDEKGWPLAKPEKVLINR